MIDRIVVVGPCECAKGEQRDCEKEYCIKHQFPRRSKSTAMAAVLVAAGDIAKWQFCLVFSSRTPSIRRDENQARNAITAHRAQRELKK
jgi:hypothetical protein